MKALFEKKVFNDTTHISAKKYKNLQNLPHWHMEYELVFVLEGSAELMVNNSFFKITKGSCAFIGSEEVHNIKSMPESILGIIKTDTQNVKRIVGNKHLTSPVLNYNTTQIHIFYDILSELKNQKDFYNIIADAIITKFIAEIFRVEPITSYTECAKKMTTKYKELLEMLAANYSHITFEKAAEYVGLNKSYFSRYFYRFSGITFTHYLNILKVSAAIEKMQEKKLNMTEISIYSGFGTIRNFNRVFKEITGYTPKKLPDNYVLLSNQKDISELDFNPTLNCTEILE